MATVTLKNIPEQLLDRLREMASTQRRSLNQQILYLLEAAQGPKSDNARLKAEADRQTAAWSRLAGRWESHESVQEELSRIYAARTEGRAVDL